MGTGGNGEIKMKKIKKLYLVSYKEECSDETSTVQTMAVSEAQAINNIKWKLKDEDIYTPLEYYDFEADEVLE